MKRFYKKIFLGFTMISLFILSSKVYGQGATCATADPFCTGTSYSFPNSTGTTAPGGNNYGCLSTQPNPAWYYMQIGTSGNIDITISQVTNSGAGIDVDFIMYGPYNSLPIALADCGNMGNPSSEIEDCSYSTASTEVANIVGGVAGQYYMLLITNYSNISGNISFSQTGGTGSTNCAIINPPCPTVGIHAENGGTSYNFPLTFSCTDAGTLLIRADDAATAGGPIVPGIQVTTTTNSQTSGNNIYGLEQNGTTWNNYWSFTNLSASTNHTLSMYEVDNVTTNSLGVEFCDVRSGSDMSFVITDLNCGGVIANSPAWGAADGTNSGSAGSTVNGDVGAATPSGGCQVVTFPKTAVKGTATYSCPTCPPGSFTGTNYGHAFFSPSIAGPGTYNITYSFDNGCAGPDHCFGSTTETITVTSPNTFTSLTYPTPRCIGSGNASPTLAATAGGSYSSGTLGGALNTSTGVINTATAPVGTHTITYTVGSGTCSASGTGTITISPNNTVSAASSSPNVCVNTAITNITHTTTGATGIGAATGLPSGVTAGWAGNTITISGTPTASGTFNYSIPLTGGCGAVNATGTITVNPNNTVTPASSTPTLCINTAMTNITHTTTGATGIGAATGLPSGVSANWSGNTITISGTPTASGTFNYNIPLTGGCGAVNATGTITVNPRDNANFAYSGNTYCLTGTDPTPISVSLPGGVFTISAPGVINASTGQINLASSGLGTYTVTYNTAVLGNPCPNTATTNITITAAPSAAFSYDLATYCQNAAAPVITYGAGASAGVFSSTPAGLSLNTSNGAVTLSTSAPGTYTVTNSIAASGGCAAASANTTITVNPNATINLTSAGATTNQTLCMSTPITSITYAIGGGGTGAGVVGLPAGVTGSFGAGVFTISGTPTASGTFNYTVTTTGTCGQVTANGTITVTPDNTVSAASASPTLCINTAMTNITHTTTGATGIGIATGLPAGVTAGWAGNTITISGTPTASGTFNYTIPLTGGCGTVNATGTITVTPDNTVSSASSTPTLCINTAMTNITHTTTGATGIGAATGLPAGVTAAWAGNTITISGTPTASGTFNYSIPLTGGCGTDAATGTITVTPDNTVSAASSSPTLCINTAMTNITHTTTGATGIGAATGLPAGVTANWSGNSITISGIPTASGTFNYTIPLTGGCGAVNATGTITVDPNDDASFSYTTSTYCITGTDPIGTVTGTAGGTFTISSPGVLLNPSTGEIDLDASGLGTFTVYYNTASAGNPCPQIDSTTINITDAPSAAFSYDMTQYCQDAANPILTFGPGASAGVFSSTPAGLNLNTTNGDVTLPSAVGVYTVYNTIAAAGGCAASVDSTTIEVLQLDDASFSYVSGNTYCITGTDPLATVTGIAGGTFTISSPGVLLNSSTGEIDLDASGLGTFTVYYNTASAGNPCPQIDSTTINIVSAPGASFTYNTPFCEGNSNPLPIFVGNNFSGTFTSNPLGVNFVSTSTGEIDLSTSTAGTYMIYNNLAASGGCAAALDSFEITINPSYNIQETVAVCSGGSYTFPDGTTQTNITVQVIYNSNLTTGLGCDSIVETTVNVNPIPLVQETVAVCSGGSYTFPDGTTQTNITTQVVYNSTLTTSLGCDSIVETTVNVNPIPFVQETVSVCSGGSYTFPDGTIQTNITTQVVYNSTLTTGLGCDSIVETTVNVDPALSATPDPVAPICLGDPLNLTATSSGNGTVTWYSDAAGTTVIGTGSPFSPAVSSPGIYTYYVNEAGTCSSSIVSVTVIVGGVTASIGATPSTGLMPLDVVFSNGSTTGPTVTYTWDFGDGTPTSNQYEPTHTYTNLGNYTATLTVSDGICTASTSIIIEVIGKSSILIPNVFTPNSDGSNDVFTVDGTNLESVEAEIFNRWGQKMYEWKHVKGYWDGRTLSGSEAPDGTYFYIIKAKGLDGEEYFKKGGFSLIR